MVDEIRADYNELNGVASKFANQEQAIQQMSQKIRSAMEKLENGGWMGEGSEAFFSEMHSVVLPAIQRLETALQQGAAVTREIAQTMRQAEDEASSPFRA
jgi:WXG100 family type VII secretion target